MKDAKLPRLNVLARLANDMLSCNTDFIDRCCEWCNTHRYEMTVAFDYTGFMQLWDNTCTGFDIAEDGYPIIECNSMTFEYTTILSEINTGIKIVCFGEKPCYVVANENDYFKLDVINKVMASLSRAKRRYDL